MYAYKHTYSYVMFCTGVPVVYTYVYIHILTECPY